MSRTQRTRFLGLLALGLGLGLLAGPVPDARAQVRQQKHLFEIGLLAGVDFIRAPHDLMDLALPHRRFGSESFDLGLRLTYLPIPWVGIELEAGLVPAEVEAAQEVSALIYYLRAHAVVQLPVGQRLVPFAVIGGGLLGVSSSRSGVGNDQDGALHWGLGLKYYLSRWAAFRFDVRHLVSDGINGGYANHFSVLVGLSLVLNWKQPKPADADRDGIPDARDRCPDQAGAAPSGCPDTDGDGVLDPDDRCPTVAARTEDGCPADKDKDGVPDEKDRCPDQAGAAPSGCPDTDGDFVLDPDDRCPKVPARTADGCPLDTDRDGVPDEKDRCPTVAARTPDGCPPDRDGDGILDDQDKCPDQPETRNGYQDEDGCPDELPKEIQRFSGTIQGILFATNSAKILRPSFKILDQAVAMLKKYPTLRLKIRGHTDNQGQLPKNMALSQQRAESVREYFIAKGIDAQRLQAEGLGPNEPVADNARPAGRARNRRIEFKVVP